MSNSIQILKDKMDSVVSGDDFYTIVEAIESHLNSNKVDPITTTFLNTLTEYVNREG